MSDRVVWTVDGGVADVRLNRPEKMNALDPAMFEALCEAGEALKHDPSVVPFVLSGEGRAFCAGLGSFQAMASAGSDKKADASAGEAPTKKPVDVSTIEEDGSRTGVSRQRTCGRSSTSRSSPWCTAWRSVAAARSCSVPTCGSARQMRSSRSWRSAGAWSRT